MDTTECRLKIKVALANLLDIVGELRVLEEALLENEERFRVMAEFAYDWEYWQDVDGRFIYCSPSCATITGYAPDEFLGDKELMNSIIHRDDFAKWKHHAHGISNQGELEPLEFRIVTKSGEVRWMHHVCRKVYGKDGEDKGIRGSNRDVTVQKQMQEEIKVLKGFLPICASCKRIRDDNGEWRPIESYVREHSEAEFSHTVCPDCAKKLYPDLGLLKGKER